MIVKFRNKELEKLFKTGAAQQAFRRNRQADSVKSLHCLQQLNLMKIESAGPAAASAQRRERRNMVCFGQRQLAGDVCVQQC